MKLKRLFIPLLTAAVLIAASCTNQPLQKELPAAGDDAGGITTLSFTNPSAPSGMFRVSITPQTDKYIVSWRPNKDTVWLCTVNGSAFTGDNYPFICSDVSDDGHTGTFKLVQTGSYVATSIPANAEYVACAFNTPVYSNGTTTSPCGPRLALPASGAQYIELNYGNSQIPALQLVLSGNGATPANQYEDAYMHVSGRFVPVETDTVAMNPVMGMLEYRAWPADDGMKPYVIYGYNTSASANNITNPGIMMLARYDDDTPDEIFASIARFNADGELDETASSWTDRLPLCVMCYNSNATTFCALQNRTETDPAVLRTVVIQKPSFIDHPEGYYALRTGLSTFGTSSANLTNWATIIKNSDTPALLTFPPGTVRPINMPLASTDLLVEPPGGSAPPVGPQPTPLTIYPETNYGGASTQLELYRFYGASDATLQPAAPVPANISSFKLNKGYMVTMAVNPDGTGYSRIWGAFDQDLEVSSLPATLAGKVAFVRVLPWENTNKKGVGRATGSVYNVNYMTMVDLQWYYNWGRVANNTLSIPFVPMAWGSDAVTGANNYNQIKNERNTCQLLAFNEPDGSNTAQSANMSVDDAIALYPKLLATGMRMGSPAPIAGGWNVWLKNFMKQAQAKQYRVDFICLHWYDADDWTANKNRDFTDAQADACVDRFKTYVQNVYNMYGLPIWITEYNCNRNRNMGAQVKFYTRAAAMLDQLDYVERHAYMIPNVANNKYSNGDFLVGDVTPLTLSDMGTAFKNTVTTRAIKTPTYESSGNLDKQYNF